MPFLNNNHLTFLSKFLRPRQLLDLEALRLSKNNFALHIEDGFTVAFADMDVNGGVIVAVKEESKSIPLENCRHPYKLQSATAEKLS